MIDLKAMDYPIYPELLNCIITITSTLMIVPLDNPIAQQLLFQIRLPSTARPQFRQCLQQLGELTALQIASRLPTQPIQVTTCLNSTATHSLLAEQPVLITILRAGIPFHTGLLNIFPEAECGFIGAMRDEATLQPVLSYVAIPDVRDRVVVLADTMLATGGSFVAALKVIQQGKPKKIIVAAVIAAKQGLERVRQHDPSIDIYYGTLDNDLNEKGYIVPGLGDAGDRSYGNKV